MLEGGVGGGRGGGSGVGCWSIGGGVGWREGILCGFIYVFRCMFCVG